MNLVSQINIILKRFEEGDKFKSYNELQKIFKKNKDNNLLRYNLAVIQQNLNFNEQARINYNYLIKSENNIKAMINLYNMDIGEAKYFEALGIINKILKFQKNENIDKDRAFVLYKLKRIKEAKQICIFYLKKSVKDITALNILGQCETSEQNYSEAIKIFKSILGIDSKNLSALNSLGRAYQEKRELIKAEKYYLKAISLNNNSFHILNNIAGFYREKLEYKKSINYYKQAISLNPNNAQIYNNLSKMYFDLNNQDDAKKNSILALEMKGNDGDIQKTLSFIYLKDHDFENGWKYFEGRLELDDFTKKTEHVQKLNNKLYKLDNIKDKKNKFLVVREQGVGDEILYSSMYIDILNDIKNTIIECDDRLLNIFRRSFPKYTNNFVKLGTITNDDNKFKQIDYVLYAGSLGRYYRKNLNEFHKDAFIKVDKKKFEEMQKKLSLYNKKYKVGLSWKSFNNRYASDKSLALNDFDKLFELSNCDIFNLQYGDVQEEVNKFNKKSKNKLFSVKDLDLYNDLDDIASLLKSLDIFFTISNSTAHLAGALGVKTVLIKPHNYALFHYWNQKSNRTPWYKSIELVERDEILQSSDAFKNFLDQ